MQNKIEAKERQSLFGSDSAETDDYLNTYFIQTGTYRTVANKEKLIVVGRKGSGKSAIFKYLNNDERTIYIKLSPNKFSLDYIRQFEKYISESLYTSVMGFTALWKYLILQEVTTYLEKEDDIDISSNIAENTIDIMDCWIKANIGANTIHTFATKETSSSLLKSLPDSRKPININLINTTASSKSIHILIDDLDYLWDNSIWCQNYIIGLIQCVFDLIHSKKFHATLFIREDIFTSIETQYHRIDNMRELIESISWTPILIKQMIARRIQTYFNLTPEKFKDDYWYYVFPNSVNGYDSFKYMVERTQLRPREMIQFCQKSYELSSRYKKSHVGYLDIIQAETVYSDWKLSDLCSEYLTQYENLINLFKAFAGVNYFYPKSDVVKIIKLVLDSNLIRRAYKNDTQPLCENEILQFLYDSGFIRAWVVDPRTGKKVYRGSSTYKNFNLHIVDEFDIHPTYRKALLGYCS